MYSASIYEEYFYADHLILILQLWIYVKYYFFSLYIWTGTQVLRIKKLCLGGLLKITYS